MINVFENDKAWRRYRKVLFSWEGTPYRHLWMHKGRGVDCSLYVGAVFVEFGIMDKVEHDYYPRDWHIHTREELIMEGFFEHLNNHMRKKYSLIWLGKNTDLMRGDVLAFSTTLMGVTNHCGILLDEPKLTMIHSVQRRGVSEMHVGNWWKKKMTSIFRVVKED